MLVAASIVAGCKPGFSFTSRRQLVHHSALIAGLAGPATADADFVDFTIQHQEQSRALVEERAERAARAAKAAAQTRPPPLVMSAPGQVSYPVLSPTDEFTVEFLPDNPLGLKLKDLRVGFETGTKTGTSRVLVADVISGGQAASAGRIEMDNIVVGIDGVNVEFEDASQVTARLTNARNNGRPLRITFRDALAFNSKLMSSTSDDDAKDLIATTVTPASELQPAQIISVRRLELPDRCRRNAQTGDLLEIRYAGRLPDGTVFDGMELGRRFADDSLQFILGKQPAGQFPPAWDFGLVGMCVGERREIDVPPVLGFGSKGLPKRGIPPNSRLLYDIELLAIDGATW